MVVTLSHTGYIKSQPLSEYRAQKRGGRGKQATATKEDDWIDTLFVANTHDYILCFSNRGRLYWLKVYEVPQGSRNSRGRPIVNMFPLPTARRSTSCCRCASSTPSTSSSWPPRAARSRRPR
jgi:DNA gyrase subunit A